MVNGKVNIFEYATKEFTIDALICMLLEYLSSNDEKQRSIGIAFVKGFLLSELSIKEDSKIILIDEVPHKQYFHMDVFATLLIDNTLYPIIIESKTDTWLHDNQYSRYCDKVATWMQGKWIEQIKKKYSINCRWGHIKFVLLKTGYIFDHEKDEYRQQTISIFKKMEKNSIKFESTMSELSSLVIFLERYKNLNVILEYVYEKLSNISDRREEIIEAWDNCKIKSIESIIGKYLLAKSIIPDGIKVTYEIDQNQNWIEVELVNRDGIYYWPRIDLRLRPKRVRKTQRTTEFWRYRQGKILRKVCVQRHDYLRVLRRIIQKTSAV